MTRRSGDGGSGEGSDDDDGRMVENSVRVRRDFVR